MRARTPEPAVDFDDRAPMWPPGDESRAPYEEDLEQIEDDVAAQQDERLVRELWH